MFTGNRGSSYNQALGQASPPIGRRDWVRAGGQTHSAPVVRVANVLPSHCSSSQGMHWAKHRSLLWKPPLLSLPAHSDPASNWL